MSRIDVSELLHDPDFVDQMTLIDRMPSINSLGENILAECSKISVGSVQPISGRALMRLPEDLRVENVQSFWFQGVIVASAPGKYSSIIIYKGQRYQVKSVQDWSSWGEGWCEGICVAEVPAP